MSKLIVAFRNPAYVPNNRHSIFCNGRLSNAGAQYSVHNGIIPIFTLLFRPAFCLRDVIKQGLPSSPFIPF